ncbi:MAG: DUF3817 domain-containing protein [Sporichthyaceae bacterium]
MQVLLKDPIGRLRVISVLEASSFLILLVCSVLKRTHDFQAGVHVMGPVHGILFVLYLLLVLDVRARLQWPTATTLKVALAAVIPVAPFFVERRLRDQSRPAQRQD